MRETWLFHPFYRWENFERRMCPPPWSVGGGFELKNTKPPESPYSFFINPRSIDWRPPSTLGGRSPKFKTRNERCSRGLAPSGPSGSRRMGSTGISKNWYVREPRKPSEGGSPPAPRLFEFHASDPSSAVRPPLTGQTKGRSLLPGTCHLTLQTWSEITALCYRFLKMTFRLHTSLSTLQNFKTPRYSR